MRKSVIAVARVTDCVGYGIMTGVPFEASQRSARPPRETNASSTGFASRAHTLRTLECSARAEIAGRGDDDAASAEDTLSEDAINGYVHKVRSVHKDHEDDDDDDGPRSAPSTATLISPRFSRIALHSSTMT